MDPFVPEQTGYRPDKFYTNTGDRPSESRDVNIKIDPLQHDLIFRLFIAPEDKFGEYRGLSDFIADAMIHRIHFLMKEYPQIADTDEEAMRDVATLTASFAARTIATQTVTRGETIRRLVDGLKMASEHESWGDTRTVERLVEEARTLMPSLNKKEQASLIIAITEAGRNLEELNNQGQRSFTSALEEARTSTSFTDIDTGFTF